MAGRYLIEMAQVLRSAGCTVIEVAGWQTRARSTGGYQGNRPWCIMWHHTASTGSTESQVLYMIRNSGDRPIANLFIARNGDVHVLAAGATNTNGKGNTLPFSKGIVMANTMNLSAIGVEMANSGVGEQYPEVQVDSMFRVNNALCDWLSMEATDLATHNLYAPTRKIDPAKANAVQGRWKPRPVNNSGSWNTEDIRTEANRRMVVLPPEPEPEPPPYKPPPFTPGPAAPPPTKDDISMVVALDSNGTAWVGDGITRYPIPDEATFSNMVVLGKAGAYRFVNTSAQVVSGWPNVATVGDATIAALGRAV